MLCGNEPVWWTDALLQAPSSSNVISAMIAVVEFNLIPRLVYGKGVKRCEWQNQFCKLMAKVGPLQSTGTIYSTP